MQSLSRKWLMASAVILAVIVLVIAWQSFRKAPAPVEAPPSATTTPVAEWPHHEVIGKSVEDRTIDAYTYGNGSTTLLFVGGIHGGYEWNSVLLAYQFMDYLEANRDSVPQDLTISVIPDANPDGTFKVIGREGRFTIADVPAETGPVGTGRFNADDVDLNRNFDCRWQPTSTWRSTTVSAGTAPFSEPEAKAIRDFVEAHKPAAVVFWHSQSNAVYASECGNGILPGTLAVMNAYANAAGYPAVDTFDAYPVTGDSEGWLASIGIPAVTVELSTHNTVEWNKNLAGIKALFSLYGSSSDGLAR